MRCYWCKQEKCICRSLVHDFPTLMIKYNERLIERGLVTDHQGDCDTCPRQRVWLVRNTSTCVTCFEKELDSIKEKQA